MGQARFNRHRGAPSNASPSISNVPDPSRNSASSQRFLVQNWDFWTIRLALTGVICVLCYALGPFGVHGLPAAGLGFLVAMVILLAELRLRRAEISGLVGGALGVVLGLVAAFLITLVISRTAASEPTKSFLELTTLFAFAYLGLVIGSSRGHDLPPISLPRSVELPPPGLQALKLLDTSALIDGRIADICETHFLDGALGIPRFILLELQHVADSSDALKRQRGRRGLEVLQRIQKMAWLEVRILEEEVPGFTAVDQKLVELARRSGSMIVTNDFNLNKVARVQGISVLNVNELANAMKPAVLPGESMRVLILREGKESAQGVAYLDDGTMVVVDGARRFINRTIDIVVTSTHQTPAGKMIFGRIEERVDSSASRLAAPPMVQAETASAGAAQGQGHASPASPFEAAPSSLYPGQEPQ
jgi:uncharacterized protein YacL